MVKLHPEYIVDENKRTKAVILPFSEWEELLKKLEELEDLRPYDEAKNKPEDPMSFDQTVDKMPISDQKGMMSAKELARLPRSERREILGKVAIQAEKSYREDIELSGFEAFGEDDYYDKTE